MTEFLRMTRGLGTALVSAFLLAFSSAPGSAAEAPPSGTFTVEYDNASLIFSFHKGSGRLALTDGSEYELLLDGYSIGAIGFSTAKASGKVHNLRQPSDINGEYSATGASISVIGGSGNARLKNRSNDVVLELNSDQSGLRLGVSAGYVSLRLGKQLKAPPPPAPMVRAAPPPVVEKKAPPPPVVRKPIEYALEFGFNKSRVSLAMGRELDKVAVDWKSEPVKFRVIGHADMVGSKGYNQKLSQARADAVKKALVARGIAASAIIATGVGQTDLRVPTRAGVRKRENRLVVISVEGEK